MLPSRGSRFLCAALTLFLVWGSMAVAALAKGSPLAWPETFFPPVAGWAGLGTDTWGLVLAMIGLVLVGGAMAWGARKQRE